MTVVLYGAKQTDDVLGYEKISPYWCFDTGNNSRICHLKSIVLEIVDFSLVLCSSC